MLRPSRMLLYHAGHVSGAPDTDALCPRLGVPGPWDAGAEPLILYRTAVLYPDAAQARGVEGHVTLEFAIAPNCRAVDIEIVDATGSLTFHRPAELALAEWRFAPELRDGKPVTSSRVRTRINFDLDALAQ